MRFLIFSLFISLLVFSFTRIDKESAFTPYQDSTDSLKLAALTVLENNCNECHSKKKPEYYFTAKTMDYFAAKINVEVFISGKMPKGKKNVLTPEDKETLRLWLEMKMKK
ncbi:MAG: putative membrane protein [Crocinitomix sp.]|jgi:uncharacterized membrane protein